MSQLPERIWAIADKVTGVTHWTGNELTGKSIKGTEYVRRDTLPCWQPIATAPRDGTYFLGFGPDYDVPMTMRWGIVNERQAVLDDQPLRWGFEGYGYTFPDVTHWMPIPKGPNDER